MSICGSCGARTSIASFTGEIRVDRHLVVDYFGNLINPMPADGQVHGGVVQGIGQSLDEHVEHNAYGQLLTASVMD